MLDNIGIRTKVLSVVVATATVGTVAAASLNTVGETRAVAEVTRQVGALRPLNDALRRERDASMRVLADPGDQASVIALSTARVLTSTLLSTTAAGLDDVDVSQLAPSARAALARATRQQAGVARLRAGVDDGTLPPVSVRGGYDEVAQALDALPAAVGLTQDDRDLSLALTTWSQGQDVVGLTEEQRTSVAGAAADDGVVDAVEAESLYADAVRRDTLRAVFAQRAAVTGVDVPSTAPELRAVRDQLLRATTAGLDGPPADSGRIDPAAVSAATSAELSVLGRAEGALARSAEQRSAALADQARSAVLTRVLVAAGLALLLVGLALLVANSIVRRLRRVTAAADALRRDLPAAVEAAASTGSGRSAAPAAATGVPSVSEVAGRSYGRDEVGRLARALDETGALALDLAAGQARLRSSVSQAFVSVARRNQSLLDRQLAAIDTLERDETDGQALSTLFELDHTTARMRRNAESLLVIAGAEGGRRSREAMSLVDVVRTGASGVEHYARVDVSLDVDPQVLPHASLALAHLVAELLENATAFSGPTAPVEVRSRRVGTGVVLTVTDHGVGLSPADLERARGLLGGEADASTADASRLGLTVVARLSRRLGVQVELDSSVAGGDGARGTTATVRVPASLLVAGALPAAAPATARGGRVGAGGAVRSPASRAGAGTAAPAALTAVRAVTGPGTPSRQGPVEVPTPAASPLRATPAAATATAGAAPTGVSGDPGAPALASGTEQGATGRARHRIERRSRWFARARHATDTTARARDDAAREVLEVVSWTPDPPAGTDGAPARTTSEAAAPPDREHAGAVRTDALPDGSGDGARPERARDAAPAGPAAPWASRSHSYEPVSRGSSYEPVRRGAGAGDQGERVSGLPRRTAGERYRGATSGQMLAPPPRAPRAGDGERAPEQVRSTLAGFRAGVARARAEGRPGAGPDAAGAAPGPDVVDVVDVVDVTEQDPSLDSAGASERHEPARAGQR